MNRRLTPRASRLYVVRWVRDDGRDIKHKYFAREHNARAFQGRLTDAGKEAALYTTAADWQPLP